MNNNWNKNDNSGRGGKGRRNGRGPRNNQRQNNYNSFSGRSERNFPKFADNDYTNNESNDWNYDNNAKNNFNNNRIVDGAGIFPWIRKHPVNPLIIPPIEQINNEPYYEQYPNNNKFDAQNLQEPVENSSFPQANDKDNSVSRSRNNSVSTIAKSDAGVAETPKTVAEKHKTVAETPIVKIKQEKDPKIKLKQERKSSNSTSSSSESSSSDEEAETTTKPAVVKKATKPPSSPLNIKLKPKANTVNSTPVKAAQKLKAVPEPTSSSSSSSSEEEASAPPAAKVEKKSKSQQVAKKETKTSKKKTSSEDDVVCIGKLENKIVLEDESEEDENTESEMEEEAKTKISNKKTKSAKKTTEKCMICGKKGHTSFQCQMICKNCSGPYHGYRTCPQPANLNTMLQLYMEFCMQQLQNFNAEKQIATNPSDSIPKPQVDSPFSTIGNNKTNKLKRKHGKASETKAKTKKSKKRKVSATMKKSSKVDSDDSSDENEDDSDSETSATESEEESSDSPVESLVSSKKKLKMKNKNASKAALNLSNLTTNPANLPLVLNGFPNLTVGTSTKQNTNTSTNALNTLLLTQMFQNAIGSLNNNVI